MKNHYKFEIAFSSKMLKLKFPSLLNKCLTTKNIKEVFDTLSREYPVLSIVDGSIIAGDHAIGNKSTCLCSGTEQQIFARVTDHINGNNKYLFLPLDNNGKSKEAK